MDEKLYDLCDWGAIEAIVYADHRNPHSILGPHVTEDGVLINMFAPKAVKVVLKISTGKKEYEMEMADEEGFFAILLPGKRIPQYTYEITYEDGTTEEKIDMYSFTGLIEEKDITKFENGICYNAYEVLGSHVMEVNSVKGVLFAVWAPNALRVSVVGEFNNWKGDLFMMSEIGETGVFWLFVPGVTEGSIYKYEMKFKGDVIALKADPYAQQTELMPADASIVCDESDYSWKDKSWVTKRTKFDADTEPMNIYELHLGSFKKPEDADKTYYTYREAAALIADYVKSMGYTHIELMPIMEYRDEDSMGYFVTGYYAPTSRYGTPDDFRYFVDYMHQQEIGVILDWVPAFFADDSNALADFDGSHLYDHMDPKRGEHPVYKARVFNYGRPQVSNFMIANALFWFDMFHVDGLRVNDVASMLYLDYGRNFGQWIPNIYGENENLENVEFFKHLNSIHAKREDGTFIIAEDSSSWQKLTEKVEDDGIGFNYKWNSEWIKDLMEYMKCDPLFRKGRHNQLTLSMLYNYSEKYILEISHDVVREQKGSIISKLPGEYSQKMANMKAIFGYMMTHPGKKLFFMGQDFAQEAEWSLENSIDWKLLEYDNHKGFNNYVKALNKFYLESPALYKKDYAPEGFEWINDMDSDRSIISFIRKSDKIEDTLLVICNFTPVVYEGYSVGVPYKGRYKEVFSSDSTEFGGIGSVNPRLKNARPADYDGRPFYINVTVPPMGIAIFNFTPLVARKDTEATSTVKEEENKKTETKKTTAKSTTKKTTTKKSTAANTPKKTTTKAKTVKNEPKKDDNKTAEKVTEKVAEKATAAKAAASKAVSKAASGVKTVAKKTKAKKSETKKSE